MGAETSALDLGKNRPRTRLEPDRQPIPGMLRLAPDEITRAKDDGRLPLDHNTRIVVVGRSGVQARTHAGRIAANAFQNVVFFDGNGARQ